jgi:hypothetical protein
MQIVYITGVWSIGNKLYQRCWRYEVASGEIFFYQIRKTSKTLLSILWMIEPKFYQLNVQFYAHLLCLDRNV